ncbi:MAG: glycoside hydrolase family 97 N-terminal domain-containing protein [Verrucomicrobiota bacterium]
MRVRFTVSVFETTRCLRIRGSDRNCATACGGSDSRVTGQKSSTSDTTWKPVHAERKTIRDHFNQLVVDLQQTAAPIPTHCPAHPRRGGAVFGSP